MADSTPKTTVNFVCTANVCRSPMAAALMRHALSAEPPPLKDLKVISSGVSAMPGDRASLNSVDALKKVGIDLANHKSQRLSESMVREALAIICMTESHRALIEMQFSPPLNHVFLMREFMDDPEMEIPDPFGMNFQAYELTRDSMVEAIPSLLVKLRELTVSENK